MSSACQCGAVAGLARFSIGIYLSFGTLYHPKSGLDDVASSASEKVRLHHDRLDRKCLSVQYTGDVG